MSNSYAGYSELVDSLRKFELIDQQNEWNAKKSVVISMGDVADRQEPAQILDLFIKLQTQAEASGGRFIFILGEEEINALTGNIDSSNPSSLEYFAKLESKAVRENYLTQYFPLLESSRELQDDKINIERNIPSGLLVKMEMFSPNGKYGRWLKKQSVIEKVGKHVFTHGSIPKLESSINFDKLRSDLEQEFASLIASSSFEKSIQRLYLRSTNSNLEERYYQADISQFLNDNNPISYRGGTLCHSYYYQETLRKRLKQLQVNRVFVGHETFFEASSRHSGLLVSLGKKSKALGTAARGDASTPAILKIDGELIDAYDKNAQIVSLKNYENTAVFYSHQMKVDQILKLLRSGSISKMEALSTGISKPFRVTLNDGDESIRALYKTIDTFPGIEKRKTKNSDEKYADRYLYEIAAFRLSEYLGFGLVPPVVEREIDGKKGSVQFWVEYTESKLNLEESEKSLSGICDYEAQRNLLRIFDLLIFNHDRNKSNILLESTHNRLIWIDHSRSLSAHKRLPEYINTEKLYLSEQVINALEKLDSESATGLLEGLLNRDQIRALLHRKRLILNLPSVKQKN